MTYTRPLFYLLGDLGMRLCLMDSWGVWHMDSWGGAWHMDSWVGGVAHGEALFCRG